MQSWRMSRCLTNLSISVLIHIRIEECLTEFLPLQDRPSCKYLMRSAALEIHSLWILSGTLNSSIPYHTIKGVASGWRGWPKPPPILSPPVFRLDALALSVIATATWLAGWVAGWVAGWLADTLRYCIKTAKPIGKLFRTSESPVILVFCDPCADTKFQGKPLQRGR